VPVCRAHIVAIVTVAAASSGACTLLARFDDLPPLDAGIDAPPSLDGSAASDAPSSSDANDAAEAGADVDPCVGHATGSYCGNDGLDAPATDLVRCDGGAVAEIIACDAGCLSLSNPFPDTCNGCNTKPNGAYCGRDFPVFPAADSDWLIQCQLGNAVQLVACQHGCLSNAAASSCAP
jgi:hypothetical protein